MQDPQNVAQAGAAFSQNVAQAQAQLLGRVAQQDRQALADFYDQVAGGLFGVAVRILGNPHEAQEVIQDVFVRIWQKASTFDATFGDPFHWALGITRNRCIDRLRSRERRARMETELQAEAVAEEAGRNAANHMGLSEEEVAAVRRAVGELPADQRQAIELAFFSGLSHTDIAGRLNQPLGTIKARIRRGMLKLRESLQISA